MRREIKLYNDTSVTLAPAGAWVEIQSKNGKSIQKYSDATFEVEYLHKSKTSFEIISIEKREIIVTDIGRWVEEGVAIEYYNCIKDAYKIILKEL